MDFGKDIDLNEPSDRINHLRDLEAQEQNSEPLDEYLNMDKLTIIKMLLASQHENEKLHARLDKQDGVEKPGDIDGVVYTPIDTSGGWKFSLVQELKNCG